MAKTTMLKKTTVYLSSEDLLILRKMANLRNATVAEVIRQSIQMACKPKTKEEKNIWDALDRIWASTATLNTHKIEKAVDSAVKEVRNAAKIRRHS